MQKLAINGSVKYYDANVLMNNSVHRTADLRTNTMYTDAKERYLDETMSGNKQEAMNWMVHYMSEALTWGIKNKDRRWQYPFAAAYDILNSLCAAN